MITTTIKYNIKGLNWPVFTSTIQGTRTLTSTNFSNASIITVTNNGYRGWFHLVSGWNSWWFKNVWRTTPSCFQSCEWENETIGPRVNWEKWQKILCWRRGKRHDSFGESPQISYCAFSIHPAVERSAEQRKWANIFRNIQDARNY